MQNINSTTGGGKSRKVLKAFGVFSVAALIVAVVAHFIWKSSGSNQWELDKEIDGVKVYSLKTPGSVLKKFKIEGVFRSKLAGIMKVMRDPNTCDDVGCVESYVIDKTGYPQFMHFTFKYPMPFPFKTREYVVLSEFRQDAQTKAIYVDFKAAPDRIPPNDGCCIRVRHMHDIWQYKPLPNGDVQVEFILDIDLGGYVPYVLTNFLFADAVSKDIPDLQKILDTEEYQNAVVDYVMEVDEPDLSAHAIESKQAENPALLEN